MKRHPFISLASLMLLSAACSSSTSSPLTDAGGAAGEDAGGSAATAGSPQLPAAGAGASAGSAGSGGQAAHAGSASSGASGTLGAGVAGAVGSGGAHFGGSGGASRGGSGGAPAAGGGSSAGAGGTSCPGAGHITYTLAKSASPTAIEQAAYDKIETAMDKAIGYYDCYTSITKSLRVSYDPSVNTADGNINGSLRFGKDNTMDYRTAMHEIGHTVGIGQTSNWGSFISGDLFTGAHALAQLKAINAKLSMPLETEVHADEHHFWPYGLNYVTEVKSEADLIAHCQMVVAIRQDLGL